MARRGISLDTTADQAFALLQSGRHIEAERAYRELIAQTHVINYEYDDWLRNLLEAYNQLGRGYESAVVQLYLHRFDVAKAALRKQDSPDATRLAARIAETERDWPLASKLYLSVGWPVHAAVALEHGNKPELAASQWQALVANAAKGMRPYEAALVHFNYGMALNADAAGGSAGRRTTASAGANRDVPDDGRTHDAPTPTPTPIDDRARAALIASQRKLEQVADDFEQSGELERAFDCYQILLRMGQQSAQFENLAEGYVNCIRVLASDGLKFYVLQYYEDFVRQALDRNEYQAAAAALQEAATYAGRVGLPYDRHYQTKAAKAWLRCAQHFTNEAMPAQMIENALLASASQFAAISDFANVRSVFEKLASLDLGERNQKRYAAIATRYTSAAVSPPDAPGLPDYLKQQHAYADIWFADLLEWEMAGDPAAVASSIVGDLKYPNGIRRRALVILLTVAQAQRSGTGLDVATQVELAELLGELQSYAALAPLEALYQSEQVEVRRAAVRALRYLYFKRSFVLVRKALLDSDQGVQDAALVAISGLHFPHAFNPLSHLFRDGQDPKVKIEALRAIGKVGSIEAADFLIGVARQHEGPIRDAAVAALREIDNADILPILRAQAEVESNPALRELLANLVKRYA